MKKFLIVPLPLIIGIFIFFLVIGAAGLENIMQSFRKFTMQNLLTFFLLSSSIVLISVSRWRIVLLEQGHHVTFFKLSAYKLSAFSISYITPLSRLGGEPVRALLLKNHGLKTSDALTSVLIDKSIETLSDAAMTSIAIIIILSALPIPSQERHLLIGFLTIIFASMAILYVLSKTKKAFLAAAERIPVSIIKRLRHFFLEVDEATRYFLSHKKSVMAKMVALSCLQWALTLAEFKVATMLIGFNAGITDLLLIMIAAGLSTLVPIPAGIGVLEAGQFSVFSLIGAGGNMGIAFSLVLRLRDVIISFLGFIFLSHEGMNKIISFAKGTAEK